jgi:hypothetical protein
MLATAAVHALIALSFATPSDARTLSNVVTVSLDELGVFDVLSSADVRRVVTLEAEKQAMGCGDDSSCLAEVAGAMGASLVVYGELGTLGSVNVLTLSAFDAADARSAGRVILRNDDLDALSRDVPGAVEKLTTDIRPIDERGRPAPTRPKVLVLDIQLASATGVEESAPVEAASEPPAEGGFPLLLVAGAGVAGLGVTGLLVGGVAGLLAADAHTKADDKDLSTAEAQDLFARRDGLALAANVGFVAGGVLLAVGAGVAATSLVVGE